MKYYDRGQTYLCYRLCQEIQQRTRGTLLDLWSNCWVAWLTDEYNSGDIGNETLGESVKTILGDECPRLLCCVIKDFPDDMTGAIATRLAVLNLTESGSNTEGDDSMQTLRAAVPTGSVAESVFNMSAGDIKAESGDVETALHYWLPGFDKYPFKSEIPERRRQIVEAISGNQNGRTSRDVKRLANSDSVDQRILSELLKLQEASSLSQGGNVSEAKVILTDILERTKDKAKTDIEWNQLSQRVETEVLLLGGQEGSEFDYGFVESLFNMESKSFTGAILNASPELLSCRQNLIASLCAIKENSALDNDGAHKCYRFLSKSEALPDDIKTQSFFQLLRWEVRHLNMIRKMVEGADIGSELFCQTLLKKNREQEQVLLDLLDEIESHLRSADSSCYTLALIDNVHATYRSLGVRNVPKNLYLTAFGKERDSCESYRYASRARTTGLLQETISILTMMRAEAAEEDNYRLALADELLFEAYSDNGQHIEAAEFAEGVADQCSSPQERGEWLYKSASAYYQADDYDLTQKILDKCDVDNENEFENRLAGKFRNLDILNKYRAGDYSGVVSLTEEDAPDCNRVRSLQLRGYSLVFLERYEEAIEQFEELLWNAEVRREERNEMAKVIGRLRYLVDEKK